MIVIRHCKLCDCVIREEADRYEESSPTCRDCTQWLSDNHVTLAELESTDSTAIVSVSKEIPSTPFRQALKDLEEHFV